MSAVRPLLAALAVTAVAMGLLLALASPAAAHASATADASGYDSRLVDVPDLDGVEWRLHPGGLFIEAVNDGSHELVVLGYDGEPYLRLGPGGAFENRRSPATYLNTIRDGDVAVPPQADADADPEWVRVDEEPRAVWHDHRTHWMAPEPPLAVQIAPRETHALGSWRLPLLHDGRPHELRGALWWVPAPPVWPLAALSLALSATALLGLRRGAVHPLRAAAALVLVVALVNVSHVVDELLARPAAPALDVISGIAHTLLFVGAGLVAAVWAWRGGPAARVLLVAGSGAVVFHQGLLHLPLLRASQLATVWPDRWVRLLVVLSCAQAVAVAAVWLVVRRRERRDSVSEGTFGPVSAGPMAKRRAPLNV